MNLRSKLTVSIAILAFLYLVFSVYKMRSEVNHLREQSLKVVANQVNDKKKIYLDKIVLNNLLHIQNNLSKAPYLTSAITQELVESIKHLPSSENTSKESLLSQYWKILSVLKTPHMETQLESINEYPSVLWATAVGLHYHIQNMEKKNSLHQSRDIIKATLQVWTHIPLIPEARDSLQKLQGHPFLKSMKRICVTISAIADTLAPYRNCSPSINEYFNSYSDTSEILCTNSKAPNTVEPAVDTVFVSCEEQADIMLAVILDMANGSIESQMLKVFKEVASKSWLFSKVIGKEFEDI